MNTVIAPQKRKIDQGPSGVLVIDKPEGWTSHDVVARVRRILHTRKVGHTGTLDPLGTGVLPVCVGDATKVAGYAQTADKVYRVTMQLGTATDTQDSTGTVTASHPLTPGVDWEARARAALDDVVGDQWQTPPMYAAVKVDGEALYKKARRGETVERKARPITIFEICDVQVALPDVTFTMHCTKGTYVRTVASDIGETLGVGAHMTALNRLASGPIRIEDAITLEDLAQAVDEERLADILHTEDHLLTDQPVVQVSEFTAGRMVQGIAPHVSEVRFTDGQGGRPAGTIAPATLCRVYGEQRGFFALAETQSDPVHPVRIRRIIKLPGQSN
ncbi:MAG: tRNA pseudouridine(55) synthase TruB [Nitrospirota bacterium]|nr:tRNA pseudouridine(55) synthase TruB [Nitrospirota bacterium]